MLLERLGKELLFFDGGMGTLLQAEGLQPGELPETWNIERKETIRKIHQSYFEAGSDIVLTNTFGANALKFHDENCSLKAIIDAAVENVRFGAKAGIRDGRDYYVALDIGPTGKLLKPLGDLSFEDAYEAFKEVVQYGEKAGADLIHIETMSDTYEVKAAVLAAKENTNLPVFATMIFDDKGKLLTGGDVPSVVALLEGLRVDALGINCGMGPKQMLPILQQIAQYTSLPIIVKPNAGLPKQRDGQTYYDVTPDVFAKQLQEIVKAGACVIGGCCGTTPKHIRAMISACKDLEMTKKWDAEIKTEPNWEKQMSDLTSVFIPAKEILSNAWNLDAAVKMGNVEFDDTYLDIIAAAKIDISRGVDTGARKKYLELLQKISSGKVALHDDRFYLKPGTQARLEFNLVAEGLRKIALLWQLIKNGTLERGSVLFWDEPEANINPKYIPVLAELLIMLEREGVQIFVSTHDYFLSKYIEVKKKKDSEIQYISLYKDKTSIIKCEVEKEFELLEHNAIMDTFRQLYREEIGVVLQ